MAWLGLHGHDRVVEHFRRIVAAGRLSSTYLLVGPRGIGKAMFARNLAQALLCQRHDPAELIACGGCPACAQVAGDTHPDLIRVERPDEQAVLPVELFVGNRSRRQDGLIRRISTKPMMGGRKIAIIDDADYLNDEAANCLLKTLEEPPPGSVILLIGSSEQRQLPTIRSRAQLIRFQPLPTATILQLLEDQDVELNAGQRQRVAELSFGSLADALMLTDPELDAFRQMLWETLAQPHTPWNQLSCDTVRFVEQAGSDLPSQRRRLQSVIQMVTLYYRNQMRSAIAGPAGKLDQQAVTQLANCVDRCTDAVDHVAANANVKTVTESWIEQLRRELRRAG